MSGRLLPARGGLGSLSLSVEAVKLAARRRANQDAVQGELCGMMRKMARADAVAWPSFLNGLSEMEKEAFVGKLMQMGRGLAGRMAGSSSKTIGRVGRTLQRPVRSPIQVTSPGKGIGRVTQGRSPLGAPPAPPAPGRLAGAQSPPGWGPGRHVAPPTTPKGVSSGQTLEGAPYRQAAPGAPVPQGDLGVTLPPGTIPPVETASKKGLFERLGGKVKQRVADRKARSVASAKAKSTAKAAPKGVKPKSLLSELVPGALLAGGAYGLYKGVPSAARFASEASAYPLAAGLGHKQFQYGYRDGQAQF